MKASSICTRARLLKLLEVYYTIYDMVVWDVQSVVMLNVYDFSDTIYKGELLSRDPVTGATLVGVTPFPIQNLQSRIFIIDSRK